MTVKTVDDFVSEQKLTRVDFIKIDVEGFELDVLDGAENTINQLKPDVFLEFNAFTLIAYGNQNPRYVLEQLKRTFPYVYALMEECRTRSPMRSQCSRSSTIISSNEDV